MSSPYRSRRFVIEQLEDRITPSLAWMTVSHHHPSPPTHGSQFQFQSQSQGQGQFQFQSQGQFQFQSQGQFQFQSLSISVHTISRASAALCVRGG